tara:strand:- start:1642 stop:2085 length:444 start_codon:yes stop_codon:yes gene_type:complete
MPKYYTQYGTLIRNPEAYASTGAPMFTHFYTKYGNIINNPSQYFKNGGELYYDEDINEETTIYKVNCKHTKKYIGKTNNLERRIEQHFTGNGSEVTKKFKPKSYNIIDTVPGFFANDAEQFYTEEYIDQYGYSNVRGGRYTNSKTLN